MKIVFVFSMLITGTVFAQDKVVHKGNLLYLQSQYEEAERNYRQAIAHDSLNTVAQFNLANALQKQKKYDEAIVITGKLAQSKKDKKFKAASYYNQGVAYTKLKNLQASIESYKNALRLDPNDKQARENLQKALLELKKQNQRQQQKKPQSKLSQKEADQKLKLLQQKEKQIQQRLQEKNKKSGQSQGQDW
jgi:Ca-activated chloride channel family protein